MNLLFVTSRVPYPPNRGDKVRTFNFLKVLSRNHSITLFSYIGKEKEKKYRKELNKFCDNIYFVKKTRVHHLFALARGLINKKPFQVNYYYFPGEKKKLEKIVRKHNIKIIYTHLIRMAPMIKDLSANKILDYTDAISMEYDRSLPHRKNLIEKLFFSLEAKRTRRYEKKIIHDFDEGWFISREDANNLDLQGEKIKIIPNPIRICESKSNYKLFNRLVFVGNMSVPHNISAAQFVADKLMPKLIRSFEVEFDIIGAQPAQVIKNLHSKNNTKVLGFVQDLFEELHKSDIFIAPMFYSAGVQNKVLEAMSIGLPVVTSPNVARSINAINNQHLLVGENTDEYLLIIKKLLNNEDLRKRIGKGGFNLINEKFSMKKIRDKLGNL